MGHIRVQKLLDNKQVNLLITKPYRPLLLIFLTLKAPAFYCLKTLLYSHTSVYQILTVSSQLRELQVPSGHYVFPSGYFWKANEDRKTVGNDEVAIIKAYHYLCQGQYLKLQSWESKLPTSSLTELRQWPVCRQC